MLRIRLSPILALSGLLAAAPVYAQVEPTGPESQIPADPAGFQTSPATAVAPSGGSLVVWQSAGAGGQETDIWARAYGPDGNPLAPEFLVNSHLPGCQAEPDVAAAPDGSFTVVWRSDGQDGDGGGIFAQRIAANGTLLGSEIQVNATITSEQRAPQVAHDASGNFVVAWESLGQDGEGWSVVARRFNSSGPLSSEAMVPASAAGHQRHPDLAFQPTGHAIFIWEGPDGEGSGIFLRRFDNSLSTADPVIQANLSAAGFQTFPALGIDASGNVIAVWENAQPGAAGTTLQALRFDRFLTQVGDPFQPDAGAPGPASRPAVASAGSGDFLVLWESASADLGGPGAVVRLFDFLEQPQIPAALVHASHPGRQNRPDIAVNSAGSFVASWTSLGQDGDGSGVLARRYAFVGHDFHTIEPCRIVDTRAGDPLTSGVERSFAIDGACGIPPTARALALNVTVASATGLGNVSLFPGDAPPPISTSINFLADVTRANNAILPLARNGIGTIRARPFVAGGGQVHLVLDVNGYFE
jgi:hypothetical protein